MVTEHNWLQKTSMISPKLPWTVKKFHLQGHKVENMNKNRVFMSRTSFYLCFCTDLDWRHFHPFRFFRNYWHYPDLMGTDFKRPIRSRISRNNDLDTITSAIWNITYLECLTTLAPIFISFTCSVLSDQSLIFLGKANRLKKLPRLYANANNWRRTWLSTKSWQESRVHFKAYLPSLIHCSAVPRLL